MTWQAQNGRLQQGEGGAGGAQWSNSQMVSTRCPLEALRVVQQVG